MKVRQEGTFDFEAEQEQQNKTMAIAIIIIILSFFGVQTCHSLTASFHGSGYLSLEWKDSSQETHLTFELLTSRSYATLLVGTGGRDHLFVALVDGVLQVRVDLGSGETILTSPPGQVLDDLKWHSVELSRHLNNLTLLVDGIYHISGKCPGEFADLNLDGALHLGGTNQNSTYIATDHLLLLSRSFRGCLRDVIMNGVNLMEAVRRNRPPPGITWDHCKPEMTSDHVTIFFPQNSSFVAFPTLNLKMECRISLDVKTHVNHAILVYASGAHWESDFLALEIVMGSVQVRINKGSGLIKLSNEDRKVNDGAWHSVSLQINAKRILLTIDDVISEEINSQSITWTLDVHEPLYVGGIGSAKRSTALRQRLESVSNYKSGSLIGGCIRRMQLNDHQLGWRQVLDSNLVEPDCPSIQGPCSSKGPGIMNNGGPCIEGASCIELDWSRFRCECSLPDWSLCYKRNDLLNVLEKNDGTMNEGFVFEADDVVVKEGGTVTLNSSVLKIPRVILLDESLRSLLFFRITVPPKHGVISKKGKEPHNEEIIITLDDIYDDRLSYRHDGSESEEDEIVLLADLRDFDPVNFMEFQTWLSDAELEEELHRLEKIWPPSMRAQNFSVFLHVVPVNDLPTIQPFDRLLIVVDTQRTANRRLLNATDPDDPPDKLEWKVFYSYHGDASHHLVSPQKVDVGYFELEDAQGNVRSRVTRFYQDDVDKGRVRFVHRGTSLQNIGLQVSDGKDSTEVVNLIIQAEPLVIKQVINTGINIVGWGGASLITSSNLTFTSNLSPLTPDLIRYEMVDPPSDGFIQRRRARHRKRKFKKKQKQTKQEANIQTSTIHIDYLIDDNNNDQPQQGTKVRRKKGKKDGNHRMTIRPHHQNDDDVINHVTEEEEDDYDDDSWEIVRMFTQAQINNGLVRYLHFPEPGDEIRHYPDEADYPDYPNIETGSANNARSDRFKFKVGVMGRESDEHDFVVRISLLPSLSMLRNGPLIYYLHGNRSDAAPEVAITSGHLLFSHDDLEPTDAHLDDIVYKIVTPPILGRLGSRGGDSLGVSSTFNQLEIEQGQVTYRLTDVPRLGEDQAAVTDDFLLSVSSGEGIVPVEFMFKVIVSRADSYPSEGAEDVSGGGGGGDDDDDDIERSNQMIVEEFSDSSLNVLLLELVYDSGGYHGYVKPGEEMDADEFLAGTLIRIIERPKYGELMFLRSGDDDDDVKDGRGNDDGDVKHVNHDDDDLGFLVSDMKRSKLIYRHIRGGSSEDMFSFLTMRNSTPTSDVMHVNIAIISPVIPFHVHPIQVSEGGIVHLNMSHVNVGDSQYSKLGIEILLVVPPEHGRMSLNGSMANSNQFSLADFKRGRITYHHDNSETTSDWMIIMARMSSKGKQSKPQLLLVDITLVDDQSPSIFNNNPIDVYPGEVIPLTSHILRIEDFDSKPDEVTYDVIFYQPMEFGVFRKNRMEVTKFTEADLRADLIAFGLKGTSHFYGSYEFPVLVKDISDNRLKLDLKFNIRPLRLEVITLKTFRAFPGVLQPITNDSLKMSLKDDRLDFMIGQIRIDIIKKPTYGRIVKVVNDQLLDDIDSFEYSLVQLYSVFYIYNHEHDTSLADSFRFRATLNDAVEVQGQIEICNSLENINKQNSHYLLSFRPLEVREGERSKFTKDNLDVSRLASILKSRKHLRSLKSLGMMEENVEIKIIILSLPSHGWLILNGENLTSRLDDQHPLEIRQNDVDGGYLQYQHDDSETTLDFMMVSFKLPIEKFEVTNSSCPPPDFEFSNFNHKINSDDFYTLSSPLHFDFHIIPCNDHHFRLLTSAPVTRVIQNGWVILNSSVLLADDLDTSPHQIIYKITDRASNGRLIYVNSTIFNQSDTSKINLKFGRNFFSEHNIPTVEKFSQMDINEGKIWFLHDGSDFQPGSIYFSVFENVDKTFMKHQKSDSSILYKALRIDVLPLELKFSQSRAVSLTQGFYSAKLFVEHFNIITNTLDPDEDVTFELSRAFHRGMLLLDDKEAARFHLKDLRRGRIAYALTELDGTMDEALMTVSDSSNVLLDIPIRISVKINIAESDRPVQVIQKNGHWFKFNLAHLNATSLAELTRDDPVYRIIEGPTRGKLRKVNKIIDSESQFRKSTKFKTKRFSSVFSNNESIMVNYNRSKRHPKKSELQWFKHSDVVHGNVEYRPYPSGSRSIFEDGFSFTLGARNVPTIEGNLKIDITPAVALDQILVDGFTTTSNQHKVHAVPEDKGDINPGNLEESDDSTMQDGVDSTPNDTQKSIKDRQNLIIAVVLALLAVLLIVGVFLIRCLCIQRRKLKEESMRHATRTGESFNDLNCKAPPEKRLLSSLALSEVHYRHNRISKHDFQDNFYDQSPSGGVMLPKPDVLSNDGPRTQGKRWSTHDTSAHVDKPCRLSTVLPTSSFQPQQSLKLTEESLMTLQHQLMHQTNNCELQSPQFADWQQSHSLEASDTSPGTTLPGENRKKVAEENASNVFGWSNIDPELLEHCRKTNPVLHKDQYWV